MKFIERLPRSFAKLVTWRIAITMSNFMVGYLVSGDPWTGFKVAIGAMVVNSIIYFLHERAWNKSDWGRQTDEKETV
jgi:uncharacterized membrane protein